MSESNGNGGRAWDIIMRWVLGLIGAGIVAITATVVNISNRVTAIEANRFTGAQAFQMKDAILAQLLEIQKQIHNLPLDERVAENANSIHEIELHLARRDGFQPEESR